MSLTELKYLASKLPEEFNHQNIIEHADIPNVFVDSEGVEHQVFGGEDERTAFLMFLLDLAQHYCEYLNIRGQTREHDYWKDGLLTHCVANSLEGWNYYNASMRIEEIKQEINRNNSYINDYFFPKYESEIDKDNG
jgi:hypothetical protein